jgi:hypothetical protein
MHLSAWKYHFAWKYHACSENDALRPQVVFGHYWRLFPRSESTPASLASFKPTGGDLFSDLQGKGPARDGVPHLSSPPS